MTYRTEPAYNGAYYGDESGYETAPAKENPRIYISTVKGVFLAILKLISGLTALAGILLLIATVAGVSERIPYITRDLTDALRSAGIQAATRDVREFLMFFFRRDSVGLYLLLFVSLSLLSSAVLNGIGTFLLRVARHGATCVQIAHIVYTVFGIILFVIWCALVTLAVIGLAVAGSSVDIAADLREILAAADRAGVPMGLYWTLMISEVVLMFMLLIGRFTYHLSIAKLMSHTRKELSQGRLIAPRFRNRLSGRCIFLIVIYGIMTTLSVATLIVTGWQAVTLIINLAVLAVVYLRLFLVWGCARDFDRAHV